jgi:hypothetical protein
MKSIAMILNILLTVCCFALVVIWVYLSWTSSETEKKISHERQSARLIVSTLDVELSGGKKEKILEVINKIYEEYPRYKSSIFDNRSMANPDCLYYGGVFFLFKSEIFVSHDKDRICNSWSLSGDLYR